MLSRCITFLAVLLVTFLLLHLAPGNPLVRDKSLPPEILQNLTQKYGLKPQGEQAFVPWIADELLAYTRRLAHGSFGPSLKYTDVDVTTIIAQALPKSVILGGVSLLLALILSMVTVIGLYLWPQPLVHQIYFTVSRLGLAMPGFVKAIVLVAVFSLGLKWLPPALWLGPRYVILPALTLAIPPYLLITELLFNGLQDEKNRPYVLTAYSKGMTPIAVLFWHILPNTLVPLLSLMGPIVSQLITGSFVVETIFAIPGLGRHMVTAILDRDDFLVMGIVAVDAGLLLLATSLAEWGARRFDPRT